MEIGEISNVWDILGIEPNSDSDTIRAAYAEKVKEAHPEDAPEKFMRLHSAYKTAMRISSAKLDALAVPQYDENRLKSEVTMQEHEYQSPTFDFADMEQRAIEIISSEKSISDSFIEELTTLRESNRYNDPEAWEVLLKNPVLEMLMHSEYFAKSFLRFREDCIREKIPYEIHTQAFIPLIEEWRGYWPATELAGKFDAIWRKHSSKNKEKKVEKVIDFQGNSIIISPIIGFIIMVIFRLLSESYDPNTTIGYYNRGYNVRLGWTIMLMVTAVACVAISLCCFYKVRKTSENEEFAEKKVWLSKNSLIIHIIISLVVMLGAIRVAVEIPRWAGYTAQISKTRLSIISATIYSKDLNYFTGCPEQITFLWKS